MPERSRYRGDNEDVLDRIRSLEKRLSNLERNTRAGNTSIGKGGTFRVYDEDGDVRVELGLLEDGTYGLRVQELDDTNPVGMPLVYQDFIAASEQCTGAIWTDLATVGPSVEVNVGSSGKLVVIASAWVLLTSNTAATVNVDSFIGVHLTGANTYTPSGTPGSDTQAGLGREQIGPAVTSGSIFVQRNGNVVCTPSFEGLNPGLTTVTLRYGRTVTGAGTVFFINRSLIVLRI